MTTSHGTPQDKNSAPRKPDAPLFDNIPAELQARKQWVTWRHEWIANKARWAKVPYIPGTLKKAKANSHGTWRSFADAMNAYLGRPDYFDGIGYVFSKDDPYRGGDLDNCLDEHGNLITDIAKEFMPQIGTYAEISQSGTGIKFIGKADNCDGCKTSLGEMYSERRFFALTGNVWRNQKRIEETQVVFDVLLARLKPTAGSGHHTRKDIEAPEGGWAAQHSADEWSEARRLARNVVRDELGGNEHGLPKGIKPTALSAFAFLRDIDGMIAKWPWASSLVYRADGTVDDSYLCCLCAEGLRLISYEFPRFIAVMSHYHGQRLLDKHQGNPASVRDALAYKWHEAGERLAAKGQLKPAGYTPKVQPKPAERDVIYSKRGRGGDHAALVDKVYTLLQEHSVGTHADVNISQLAADMGIHRRTVTTVLDELQASGRIGERKKQAGGKGLLIDLAPKRDVIYSEIAAPVLTVVKPDEKRGELLLEEYSNNHTVYLLEQPFDHISQQPTELETLDTLTDLVEQGLDLARATNVATRKMYGFVLDFVLTYGTKPYKPASVAAEYDEVLTLQQYQRRAERIREKPTGTLRGLADSMATQSAKYQQRGEYKRAYAYRCIAETCLTEIERRENIPLDEQGMPLQPAAGMPMPSKEQIAWAEKPMIVDTDAWQQWCAEQTPQPAPTSVGMAEYSALWAKWGMGADLSHLAAPQAVRHVAMNTHAVLLRHGLQFAPFVMLETQTCPQTTLNDTQIDESPMSSPTAQVENTSPQNVTQRAVINITSADVSTGAALDVAPGWIVRKFGRQWYAHHEATNTYTYTATKAQAIAVSRQAEQRHAAMAAD